MHTPSKKTMPSSQVVNALKRGANYDRVGIREKSQNKAPKKKSG